MPIRPNAGVRALTQSYQTPRMNRVTRCQVKISANALIIMAKALASRPINSNPFTYVEAMDSPQRDHWKRAMEEEFTLILLNNTFTTLNSREATQLPVMAIGSKWVYETKHNPDSTLPFKACWVIIGYEQIEFGETYAPVGKLTTFRVSHLPVQKTWLIHRSFRCGHCGSQSPGQWRWCLYDPARGMAGRTQHTYDHWPTKEGTLRSQTTTPTLSHQ